MFNSSNELVAGVLGAPTGTVLSMMITGFITDALGWQSSFYLFGQ